ncbi:SDR family NAD(P)-dependent oxidoreductase [Hamadaea tsunoensis]|uniref:SDR family NAD(P)-dependent oxidoreductase n=1 Tax=Hamadaea tsunoensis TaxID=53368 RepID=UPI00041E93A6|nr:SDR family oxidoreductase [Hamadaea tsunoensis]
MSLTGKTALVTGGSRGIGAATARRLADSGANVVLTYVNGKEKAEGVVRDIEEKGGRAVALRADAGDPAAVTAAVDEAAAAFDGLDILVNNAGILVAGAFAETAVDDLDRLYAVNIRGVFVATQAAVRHLPEGGRVITVGSALAERVPSAGLTAYTTAKAALAGLTRGLARDLAPQGINAVLVHAGLIDTDMNPADGPGAQFFASIPALGRYGTPEEIAETVVFLAGPGGRYITGTAITVDGGFAA